MPIRSLEFLRWKSVCDFVFWFKNKLTCGGVTDCGFAEAFNFKRFFSSLYLTVREKKNKCDDRKYCSLVKYKQTPTVSG